jgi:hypothetical protein
MKATHLHSSTIKSFAVSLLCCVGSLFLVAGCATPVKTDYKAGASFSQYRTFALLPLPQKAPAEDPGLIPRIAQPAREAVETALTGKGLTEAPIDGADLAVNFKGQSLPRVEVRDYGYTYPVMTRQGTVMVVENPSTSITTYTERTLIIEILDNHTKELVWVGSMKRNSSKPVSAQVLQEAIRKILAEFPPHSSR